MTVVDRQSFAPTSESLRAKAEEYLRVAAAARDPVAWRELHVLAESCLQRARELEATAVGDAHGLPG